MNDCVFCKIINRELPASIIYEDDKLFAFLNNYPITEGHVCVLPKQHYPTLRDTPENLTIDVVKLLIRIEKALWNIGIPCEGTNIIQNNGEAAGQDVFHIHFHVVPRVDNDGFEINFEHPEAKREKLEVLSQKIKLELE